MKETVIDDTMKVGKELVDLCRAGRLTDAIDRLYSPEIVSIEAADSPDIPGRVEGVDGVRGKNEWWGKNHDVHSTNVEGPWPNGDRFIVRFNFDVTPKSGPMAGKRMAMDETALYTVADGKIVQEEFFYNMS
jgi:ketosteroid isomerase-like protein